MCTNNYLPDGVHFVRFEGHPIDLASATPNRVLPLGAASNNRVFIPFIKTAWQMVL